MIVLIITNHYAFLDNQECIDFFKRILKRSENFKIFYDQSHFVLEDYSNELSKVLDLPVLNSGIFKWQKERLNILYLEQNKLDIISKMVDENEEIKLYAEGLYSPFQKKTYQYLYSKNLIFSCFFTTMPYFFQKINLDD